MKWKDLKDGQKVVLQQDLLYLDDEKAADYSYMTRAEIEALITVEHKTGTELTFSADGGFGSPALETAEGREIGIASLDEEIDPAIYLPIVD